MTERQDGAAEHPGRVLQAAVGAFVDQGVRELAGQGLGYRQVRHVAIGDEKSAFDRKEVGQFTFQPTVERMIAGGFPRSGDVQTELIQRFAEGTQHNGMRSQPEVIASREVGEPPPAAQDASAVDLLEGFGEGGCHRSGNGCCHRSPIYAQGKSFGRAFIHCG